MSDRRFRIIASAIILFLMGLMGANIVVRVSNQRQNVPIEVRDQTPFGTSEQFFTPEEIRAREDAYRGRIEASTTPPR